ncbi:MAG: WD40 repeat domain-containing protein, partial [Cyclobacteriaceae bacterium]
MKRQIVEFSLLIFCFLSIGTNLNAQVSSIRIIERKDHNALSLAVNPTNSQIATGGDDQRVILWNTETGQPDAILSGNTGWVTSVDFIQEGKKLIAGDKDGNVVLFDLTTNTTVHTFSAHKGTVFSLDWNVTNNLMASAGADGMLRIWDLNSRQ